MSITLPPHVQVPPPYQGKPITTDLVQKILDENRTLIFAVLENQNLGRLAECTKYQQRLQQNLIFLATVADSQPGLKKRSPSDGPGGDQSLSGSGSASTLGALGTPASAGLQSAQNPQAYMRPQPASSAGMQTSHSGGYPTYVSSQHPSYSSAYAQGGQYTQPQSTGVPQPSYSASSQPVYGQQAHPQQPTGPQPPSAMATSSPYGSAPTVPTHMLQRPTLGQTQQGLPQYTGAAPTHPTTTSMQQQPVQTSLSASDDRPWTADENRRFIEALRTFGPKELDKVTAAVQSRTKPQVQLHIQRYIYKLREEQARQASAQQANQGPSTPTGAQPQSAYAPTASQQPTQTQQPASQLPQQPPSYNPPPHLAHLTPQQLAQLSQRAHQSAAQPSQATPTQPLPQSAQYAYQQQVSRGAPPSYSTSTAQQGSASKPAYGAYSAPTAAQPRMAPGQATPSGSSLAQPKQQGVSAQGAPSSAGPISPAYAQSPQAMQQRQLQEMQLMQQRERMLMARRGGATTSSGNLNMAAGMRGVVSSPSSAPVQSPSMPSPSTSLASSGGYPLSYAAATVTSAPAQPTASAAPGTVPMYNAGAPSPSQPPPT